MLIPVTLTTAIIHPFNFFRLAAVKLTSSICQRQFKMQAELLKLVDYSHSTPNVYIVIIVI